MRAAFLVKPRSFTVGDFPDAMPGPGEVLVRTDAVGVCGSDVHYFQDGRIGDTEPTFPFVLGHETAGTIVERGPGIERPPIGTRVAIEPGISCGACPWCLRGDTNLCPNVRFHGSPPVPGTFRQFVVHPARLCIPMGDAMSSDDAVMLEPLAIGVHAVRLVGFEPGATVAVLGCGPVGAMCLAVAAASGAARVIAIDRIASRLDIARRLGATEVVDTSGEDATKAVLGLTDGTGADVVFEATNDPDAAGTTIGMTTIGGSIGLIGIPTGPTTTFDAHTARRKGLTVRWVRRSRRAVEPAIALVRSGRVQLDGLVTHHFPLDGVQEAFETVDAYRDGVFKAVIEPNR